MKFKCEFEVSNEALDGNPNLLQTLLASVADDAAESGERFRGSFESGITLGGQAIGKWKMSGRK